MDGFNRIKVNKDSTNKLKYMKGKLGLTPNILCRIALCYSLENENILHDVDISDDGQEFNRYTLTGEYDSLIVSLVKERCIKDGLDPDESFMKVFKQHLNNGVSAIHSKVKTLNDIYNLV